MTAITISLRVTAPGPAVARVSVGRRQFSIGRRSSSTTGRRTWQRSSTRLARSGARSSTACASSRAAGASRSTRSRRWSPANCRTDSLYLEVIGESGRPRIRRIVIKVFVASMDDRATRALFDEMIERLPLVSTQREALDLDVELVQTS
jgi:hypothetical protein